jgi:D-glycero-alpha-D-manno-heptose-7-phosphate kinase
MIISKTPLRLSFAGGGTDLPSFYRNNEYGAVLSTSINSYLYVSVKKHTPIFEERIRLNYADTELVNDIESIDNTIIRECLKYLEIDDRIYISTISDVPGATGLGSSSSFAVGLLNALYKYKGVTVSQAVLADEAAHIEIDILNNPIGKQDHYAAAFGGFNYFKFGADDTVTLEPIIVKSSTIKIMFDSILTFWTGVTRPSKKILAEQERKNTTSQTNIQLLLSMRTQADQLKNMFNCDKFNTESFGEIIHKGWEMKKSLAPNISNETIDTVYSLARKHGAIGGKISGAGGGGFLSIVANQKDHNRITNSLNKNGLMSYRFNLDSSGTRVYEI